MSAFMCNDYHISILAAVAADRYHCISQGPEQVGAMLHAANLASIQTRYPSDDNKNVAPFKFDTRALVNAFDLSTVAILKACRCFNYQACEVANWENTEACHLINTIIAEAIGRMPGYDESEWELTPKDTGGRVLLSSMIVSSSHR